MAEQEDLKLNIKDFVDTIKINGKYYYVHDLQLRDLINAEFLDDTPDTIPTSNVIYQALRKKLNVQSFEDFVASLPEVAFTGDFNDLSDIPSGLGVYVDGFDLVFTGPSTGGMSAIQDEDLSHLVGNGVI